MRHEEINDIISVTVEPGDERATVLERLRRLNGEPKWIVVVLPEDAVLRRPGDLRELKQITAGQDRQLVLVLEGNERLRLWARRQGYSVFSTAENCWKALPQLRADRATGKLLDRQRVTADVSTTMGMGSAESRSAQTDDLNVQIDALGEMYRSPLPVLSSRKITGQFKIPGEIVEHTMVPRVTGPLVWGSGQLEVNVSDKPTLPRLKAIYEPMDLAFVEEGLGTRSQKPLKTREIDPRKGAQEALSFYTEHTMNAEHIVKYPVRETDEEKEAKPLSDGGVARAFQNGWTDKLMLLLVILLVLGIMGGVGFGYLLTLMHPVPGLASPSSYLYR